MRKPTRPSKVPPALPPLRILIASSEVHPYSKTGGLADMVAALGKSMARRGHRVGVVTPLYKGLREKFPGITHMDYFMRLPLGSDWVEADVHTLEVQPNLTIYFIHQPGYFDRRGIYSENNIDYPDNAQRFFLLSKAAVHLARYLLWQPQVVHIHDWQTGLIPAFMNHQARHEGWMRPPASLLTIHNLAYQGLFAADAFKLTNLPLQDFSPDGVEFNGLLGCLKSAILSSDAITTVSPRYAREITTPEFGCGLDPLLRHRSKVLRGILNGVDYEEWQTEKNPFIPEPYAVSDLEGKAVCKAELQARMGLPVDPSIPLFGSVTRLADQKGMDILLGALEEMLPSKMQFVLLGSGSPELERHYLSLSQRWPGKVSAQIGYDHGLSHQIEAGADFFLMPSRFEPCGLNQMYSLRYGTIPIVRVTGGLDDSVVDLSEDRQAADGIKFQELSPHVLARAIRKALALFASPDLLNLYRIRAMKADFSWDRTSQEYESVYRQLIEARGL
ncbi:MAG: glycogen synthase GlgA [Verrucomicrobia bacterium]|nr:glycogen synthase GlgA [Verrucomicrobiota bacterium]